jgi:uncharacterized RmlC-like cupin family protein
MQYQSIRVVPPGQFDFVTAQARGSQCLAAHLAASIDSPMWGSTFSVERAARTAIRHHGEQHTIIYAVSRSSHVRSCERIITQTPFC